MCQRRRRHINDCQHCGPELSAEVAAETSCPILTKPPRSTGKRRRSGRASITLDTPLFWPNLGPAAASAQGARARSPAGTSGSSARPTGGSSATRRYSPSIADRHHADVRATIQRILKQRPVPRCRQSEALTLEPSWQGALIHTGTKITTPRLTRRSCRALHRSRQSSYPRTGSNGWWSCLSSPRGSHTV